MDPAPSPGYAAHARAHGNKNPYNGLLISAAAYNSPTQENATQSAGGICLWEQQLCYSKVEEDSGVEYHPGYLIFYPTAVVIIPFPRTISFQETQERKGTGVFHPLPSVPSRDGNFIHLSQYNHPRFPRLRQITKALYLTEAAVYTIGCHFSTLAMPSCRTHDVRPVEGDHGVQKCPSSSLETLGALQGEYRVENCPSSSPDAIGALEGEYSVEIWSSSSPETTPRDVCTRSLHPSTSAEQMSSKSWTAQEPAQEARSNCANKDEQDQQSMNILEDQTPVGTKRGQVEGKSLEEPTPIAGCRSPLPSSASGKPASSKFWKTKKARGCPSNEDEQDQPSQDTRAYQNPLGRKPRKFESKSLRESDVSVDLDNAEVQESIERLGDPVTSSVRTKDSRWPSGQDIATSTSTFTCRTTLDGIDQVTPSVLPAKKGNSQVDEEIEELPSKERTSNPVDEEIEGAHRGTSVELEDQEYGAIKICHLHCQVERALCTHRCPSPSHPGDCPPCKVLMKQDCHCKALVHSFSCDQLTSASETERERMCSCGGPCHKKLPKCAHMCSEVCHRRPCQPSNCHKKVMLRCKCKRLKQGWLCSDVQEAKLWEKSSPKQKRFQRGEYIGLIPCDHECSQSVAVKETQNEAEVQRNGKEAEACEVLLAIPRRRWSFTGSKVVIALLAILMIIGALISRPMN